MEKRIIESLEVLNHIRFGVYLYLHVAQIRYGGSFGVVREFLNEASFNVCGCVTGNIIKEWSNKGYASYYIIKRHM